MLPGHVDNQNVDIVEEQRENDVAEYNDNDLFYSQFCMILILWIGFHTIHIDMDYDMKL